MPDRVDDTNDEGVCTFPPSIDVINEPVRKLRPANRVLNMWINHHDPLNREVSSAEVTQENSEWLDDNMAGGMVLPQPGKFDQWKKTKQPAPMPFSDIKT